MTTHAWLVALLAITFTRAANTVVSNFPAGWAATDLGTARRLGAAIFNATIGAPYRYSLIQDVCDEGKPLAVATTYRRSDRSGKAEPDRNYPAYADGSQFVRAAMQRQPFTLVVRSPSSKRLVVFFQDVWSRPGRWTGFSFEFEGRIYSTLKSSDGKTQPLRTIGNRLFIATVD